MISHNGIIIEIDGRRIDVGVQPEDACGSCKARAVCGMGESGQRVVSVMSEVPGIFGVGEEVQVSTAQMMGIKAVVWAYVYPLFIMLAVLLTLLEAGVSDGIAGLVTLGSVALYYAALFLFFRGKLEKTIIFKIDKIV